VFSEALGASGTLKAQSENENLPQKTKKTRKYGVVTLLLFLIFLVASRFVIQEALTLILKTPYPVHSVWGVSMEPTLKNGDLLIIEGGITGESVYAHLGNGDIIVFHDPRDYNGTPIVHRAIDKYKVGDTWYIVTKGDNNGLSLNDYNGADDWFWYFPTGGNYSKAGVPESYIVGKVVFWIPYLGSILETFDEPIVNLGAFAVTLREVLVIILFVALVYLELTDSEEEKMNHQKLKNPEKKSKQQNEPLSINCSS
jgi:signal peptidase I